MTLISEEHIDALLERLAVQSGVPEWDLSPDEQVFLVHNAHNYPQLTRFHTPTGWRWKRNDIDYGETAQEEKLNTIREEAIEAGADELVIDKALQSLAAPMGSYSVNELWELNAILGSGQELSFEQQRILLSTALQLTDALSELKEKAVAPLDRMRDLFGSNYINKVFVLQADFDEEHPAGTQFLLYRMNESGTIFGQWEDGSNFEMESYDWMHWIRMEE